MSCTRAQALDEMLGLFNTAWNNGAAAIVGYVPEIRWPGVEVATLPDDTKYWARVSTQTVAEGDAGIGADEEGNKRRYSTAGLIFVQCFGPMSGDAEVMEKLEALSDLAKLAFRGKKSASGVWFRNVRTQELSPDDKFQRRNAVAEFQYLEIG